MIRLIVTRSDIGAAVNIGGPVFQEHKTFDVSLPEVEAWLREEQGTYERRRFVGIEIRDEAGNETDAG